MVCCRPHTHTRTLYSTCTSVSDKSDSGKQNSVSVQKQTRGAIYYTQTNDALHQGAATATMELFGALCTPKKSPHLFCERAWWMVGSVAVESKFQNNKNTVWNVWSVSCVSADVAKLTRIGQFAMTRTFSSTETRAICILNFISPHKPLVRSHNSQPTTTVQRSCFTKVRSTCYRSILEQLDRLTSIYQLHGKRHSCFDFNGFVQAGGVFPGLFRKVLNINSNKGLVTKRICDTIFAACEYQYSKQQTSNCTCTIPSKTASITTMRRWAGPDYRMAIAASPTTTPTEAPAATNQNSSPTVPKTTTKPELPPYKPPPPHLPATAIPYYPPMKEERQDSSLQSTVLQRIRPQISNSAFDSPKTLLEAPPPHSSEHVVMQHTPTRVRSPPTTTRASITTGRDLDSPFLAKLQQQTHHKTNRHRPAKQQQQPPPFERTSIKSTPLSNLLFGHSTLPVKGDQRKVSYQQFGNVSVLTIVESGGAPTVTHPNHLLVQVEVCQCLYMRDALCVVVVCGCANVECILHIFIPVLTYLFVTQPNHYPPRLPPLPLGIA